MGCDIHLHIEVKLNGKWEHYAAPYINRWYRLFGAMAGVRNKDEEPIAAPKGFPSDASELTRIIREDYGADGHTDSWLGHNEIMTLEDRLRKWQVEDGDKGRALEYDLEWGVLHTCLADSSFTAHWRCGDWHYLPAGVTDVRFVFWFDN